MDYGGYNSAEVNALIDKALTATRIDDAEMAWAAASARILEDMAIVPLVETKLMRYRSSRVRNCLLNMWSFNCDMTGLWLNEDAR
jgi:peptide/nickel transport system substrate-binding protein